MRKNWQKRKERKMYKPKNFKIQSIESFTDDIKLFRVKTDINPMPGQFFEVSVFGRGECPLASCSCSKKYVDMLVRKAGNVTNGMFNMKKGQELGIRGPYGKGFPIEKLRGKNIILVAGGTGIAPITSFIEYAEKNRKDFGNIEIYFGFRNSSYILLKRRLGGWEKKFKVVLAIDKPEKDWKGETGFLHEVIGKHKPGKENALAFLCGPEIMMKGVTESLNKLGFTDDNIYWSMERRMECGMGSCGRCLIQDVYTCRDGPVFRYDFIKPKLENEASNK